MWPSWPPLPPMNRLPLESGVMPWFDSGHSKPCPGPPHARTKLPSASNSTTGGAGTQHSDCGGFAVGVDFLRLERAGAAVDDVDVILGVDADADDVAVAPSGWAAASATSDRLRTAAPARRPWPAPRRCAAARSALRPSATSSASKPVPIATLRFIRGPPSETRKYTTRGWEKDVFMAMAASWPSRHRWLLAALVFLAGARRAAPRHSATTSPSRPS